MIRIALAIALVAATFSAETSMAKSKISKADRKAFAKACKEENPGAKKSAIKKCVKEKAASRTT
ncbi:MAG: hypothetical protein J7501_14275 [Bdellovibrio sp.]|nr:hypothetical protein [Bdellovibrio sp.]